MAGRLEAASFVGSIGTVCKLDENGLLIGKRETPIADLETYRPKPGEVVFRNKVDNDVGRYIWNGTSFMPISNDLSVRIQSQPDLILGIMRGLEALITQGVLRPVPTELQRAVDWYKNTIDGQV